MKSTKVLVLSDSHGDKRVLEQVLQKEADCDYVFHLGDYAEDARYLQRVCRAPLVFVRGNCDMGDTAEEIEQIVMRGQTIILAHGHQLGVKYSLDRAFYYATEQGAQALLFGHSHVPVAEYQEGIWLVNPGSIGEPRGGLPSYAVLLVSERGVVPKIMKFSETIFGK